MTRARRSRSRRAAFAVAALLLAASAPGAAAEDAESRLRDGAAAFARGDYAAAERSFEAALQSATVPPAARLLLARARHARLREAGAGAAAVLVERAVSSYRAALAADPSDEEAFQGLAALFEERRDVAALGRILEERVAETRVPEGRRVAARLRLARLSLAEARDRRAAGTLDRAAAGAARALALSHEAIAFEPASREAWSAAREASRFLAALAETRRDVAETVRRRAEAAAAEARLTEIAEAERRASEESPSY